MWISTFNNSGQGYVSGNSVKPLYRLLRPARPFGHSWMLDFQGPCSMLESGRLPLEVGRIHTGEFMRLGLEVVEVTEVGGGHGPWMTHFFTCCRNPSVTFFGPALGGWSFGSFSGELKNTELLYIPNLWPWNLSGFEMRIFWELSRCDTSWHLEWNCFLWRMPPLLYRRNIWRYCILWSLKQQSGYCNWLEDLQ